MLISMRMCGEGGGVEGGGAPGVEGSRCTEWWRRAVASWSIQKRPRGTVIMGEASRDAHLI